MITPRSRIAALCAGTLAALSLGAGTAGAATIEVDSGTDDGTGCTLREAIASADGNADSGCAGSGGYGDDTVTFAPTVTGTIPLTSPLTINPTATGTLAIEGPGAGVLALGGQDSHRVLEVTANANSVANAVSISGLEIRDGRLAAVDNSEALGAGVFNQGRLTLDRIEVDENEIAVNLNDGTQFINTGGGGIANRGTLVVDRSTISDNSVSATVVDPAFAVAVARGGGILTDAVNMNVSRSLVSGNSVNADATGSGVSFSFPAAEGGGVALATPFTEATGSLDGMTVVGNSATATDFGSTVTAFGGGVALVFVNAAASLSVGHSTIAANSVSVGGPAAANLFAGGGTMTVQSTVIAEPQGGGTNCNGDQSSAGHNLADDSSCDFTGTGDQPGTPAGLQALADNGGPTLTRRPAPGSALIDGGVAAGQTTDQRGLPRTVDYDTANATGGDGTDIGAVEIQGATPTATNPASPSTDTSPEVIGTAEPGTMAQLYRDSTCSTAVGTPVTPAVFASPGITVTPALTTNSSTQFRATATYGSATSACSTTGVAYVVPPPAPALTSTTPPSGSNENDPRIKGTADAGTTVNLYTVADCSGPVAGTGTDADLSGLGIAVHVADNTTTTFYAQASSSNGTSPCSAGITYAEVTPPPPPPDTGTNPPGTNPPVTPAPGAPSCKKGQKLKKGKCVKKKRKKKGRSV